MSNFKIKNAVCSYIGHGIVVIEVTGCSSAQLPCSLSNTYDPMIFTWLPIGGILIF